MTAPAASARPVPCRAEGCGRLLRDPVSRSLRMGPVCRKRAGIVVVTVTASGVPQVVVRTARRRGEPGPDQLLLDLGEAS
jgi:hypothetical protein